MTSTHLSPSPRQTKKREDDARTGVQLRPHPHLRAILSELHARPFQPLATPVRLLHFGLTANAVQMRANRKSLAALYKSHNVLSLLKDAKHHHAILGGVQLRWEEHSEFTTYTWTHPIHDVRKKRPASPFEQFPLAGSHLISVDVQLAPMTAERTLLRGFDTNNMASLVEHGAASVATDFRPDEQNYVRIVVLNKHLNPVGAGALVQRVLEIETYRALALLGLREARRLAPKVQWIEETLAKILESMVDARGLVADKSLLAVGAVSLAIGYLHRSFPIGVEPP